MSTETILDQELDTCISQAITITASRFSAQDIRKIFDLVQMDLKHDGVEHNQAEAVCESYKNQALFLDGV